MDTKEKWINETLESIEGMNRAGANPFLFEKVMNRMNAVDSAPVLKPATLRWAISLTLLLVALNIAGLLHYNNSAQKTAGANENGFAQEYFSYITNY